MSSRRTHGRLAVFMGVAVVFFVALLGRTFYVQVVAAPSLQEQADKQHVRTVSLDAPRGTLFDRNGDTLAISQTMASIYADPRHVKDPVKTALKLSPILQTPAHELAEKLTGNSGFRYLARKVDLDIGARVNELGLAGIGVMWEPKRVYPKGALAPQLLGFVGGERYLGMEGIEYEYDEVLSGTPGQRQVVRDRLGNRLSTLAVTEPVPGSSLTLTIDSEIQFEAEKALSAAVEEFEATRGCALVMDPKSGEILAMASTPSFSPDDYGSQERAKGGTRNWIVTDQCEPGSTFKMVTVAAALENRIVTPDTSFNLPDELVIYDKTIHEADENVPPLRTLTVTQILAQSSNIGAVTLGKEVGRELLVDMIERFGFTKKLGIDFPGETSGQLPAKWNGVTLYQVPMGQGIAVSPLQLAAAYAAIANDGVLIQPHLVREGVDPWNRRVVSPEVAAQLRAMLTVTVEEGTGTRAQLQGYKVAGKTGTAQKPNENRAGYSDEYIASFVGMVPADSPQLVILVMIDEPQTQHKGAKVAAPVFAQIADFALKRLGIAPEKIAEPPAEQGASGTALYDGSETEGEQDAGRAARELGRSGGEEPTSDEVEKTDDTVEAGED